ncbi:MAG: hypothetical protein K9L64_01275 [Candidatus Izimaplasma sp.]|nr:hypothetical protein [Candidatus Izimaplasma bacterium]
MLSIVKKILIVLSLVSTSYVVVNTTSINNVSSSSQNMNDFTEDLLFESSRYTHPDDLRNVDLEDYVEITRKDEEILENDQYILHLNEDTLGMKVVNKLTGYVWSTTIDNAQAGTFSDFLESGIGFEYLNVSQNYNNRKNIGITETEFTFEQTIVDQTVKFDVNIEGACADRLCSRYYDRYIAGQITLEQMIEEYNYTELKLEFSYEVTLTESGLEFYIPIDSIYEGNSDVILLSSIIPFPGLGATYLDDIPGYMMIPDGAGALIRYEDNEGKYVTPYESSYFGSDFGITRRTTSFNQYRLSLPIFGAVHGVNQNAFLGIVESGSTNARLIVFPNGATNVDYNLIYNKFDLKQTYTQSFTTDRTGGALRVYESNDQDIHIRYDFLDGDQANYVGMAQAYQNKLVEDGVFEQISTQSSQIPVHTRYLMSDSRSRFIGRELIEMTDVNDIDSMYDYFIDEGLSNQRVSLLGWNDGGYSGQLPSKVDFENKLGRNKAFIDLIEKIEETNELLLVNNYVIGSNSSDSLSYGRDVAEAVDRFKLETTCENCVYKNRYLLYPEFSLERAMDDLADYQEKGVDVLFESLGSILFTYFDDKIYTRKDSLDIYKGIIESYQNNAQYVQPNYYAFVGLDSYYDIPLYNNQYNFFDDLVPILQIVLSGYVEMFSQHMNFNSLGRTQLLMLIDYNVYPSYLLTEARPSKLAGTDVEYFYSSEFDVWKETIVEEYQWINDALSHVQGEEIISRIVPDEGIAVIEYSNGIEIIINYTQNSYTYDGEVIQPINYLVRGV